MDTAIELEIGGGPEPGTYVVRVLRSVGGGEPTTTFRLDVDGLLDRRAAIEDSVLSSSVAARRLLSPTEAAIQGVGRLLFDSVFTGDVNAAYRTSLAVASDRGKGVQIVLRLTAPGLAALPWEALFDAETGTYLCRKEPLVRRVAAPYSPPALAVDPPLRILGMISSPRGLATAGRRARAPAARGGAATASGHRPGADRLDRRGDLAARARQASRARVARAALHRPRHVRRRDRRGRARVRGTRRPRRPRHRVEPRGPARRGRTLPSARAAQLVPLRSRWRRRPLLRHRGGARAQRNPRGRGDAVLDQRRSRDRVRPRVLLRARTRARHRRGGAQRPHRDSGHHPRDPRVGHAGAVPPRRRHPAVRRRTPTGRPTRRSADPLPPATTVAPPSPPARDTTPPVPSHHAADSGDIPATRIPIVYPDAVPPAAAAATAPPSAAAIRPQPRGSQPATAERAE